MAKSQTIQPKLESLKKLEVLLEILNEQSDGYIPDNELKTKFKERLNPNKKLDDTRLENIFNNTITYALGLNDKVGRPIVHTPEYLAAIAQIWQTKLIDLMPVSNEINKENCYMITIKGIEVLNQLRNSRHSKELLILSKRLEILTIILIIFTAILIATKPLYVSLGVLGIVIFIAVLYFIFMKVYRMWKMVKY
jgi:hypothetical protein